MMTIRWQGTNKDRWESPVQFSKSEQGPETDSRQEEWGQIWRGSWSLRTSVNFIYILLQQPTRAHNEKVSKMNPLQPRKSGPRKWKGLRLVESLSAPSSDFWSRWQLEAHSPKVFFHSRQELQKHQALWDPWFPFRWEINQRFCAPTVKYTQLGWQGGRFSFC